MDKEQILSTLTEKLGQTSLSPRTLDAYVENFKPADGAEPDDAYWEKATKFIKALEGQYSHDVATKVEDFKKNYKPDTNQTPPPSTRDDDALTKRLAALEERLADADKKTANANLVKSVKDKATELKVSNQALWDDVVESIGITDEMDTDKLLTAAKAKYESKLKAYNGEGASPYGGTGRTGGVVDEKAANAKRAEFIARKQAEGRLPKQSQ